MNCYAPLEYTGFLSVNCSNTLAARVNRSPDSPTQQLMINLSTFKTFIGFTSAIVAQLIELCNEKDVEND